MTVRNKILIVGSPNEIIWRDRLISHLSAIFPNQLLQIWDENYLPAGKNKASSINDYLSEAHIAVLLLSAEFFSLPFLGTHIKLLRARYEAGLIEIFPILLRPYSPDPSHWITQLAARPRDGAPLARYRRPQWEKELSVITSEIADRTRTSTMTQHLEAAIESLDDRIRRYDLKLRKQQLREAAAQSSCNLSVTISASLLPLTRGFSNDPAWTLETRVAVKNLGHQSWCLPTVYVAIKALVDTTTAKLQTHHYGTDPDRFAYCEGLEGYQNLARLEHSMHHMEPNEEIGLVRWDIVNGAFIERYPIILIHAETLAMRVSLVGNGYSHKLKKGPYRDRWTAFMEEDDGRRHKYIVLGRTKTDEVGPQGERLSRVSRTLLFEDGTPDLTSSDAFRSLLDSTYRYTHTQTFPLYAALGSHAG